MRIMRVFLLFIVIYKALTFQFFANESSPCWFDEPPVSENCSHENLEINFSHDENVECTAASEMTGDYCLPPSQWSLFFIPSLQIRGGDGRSYHRGYQSIETFFALTNPSRHHYFFFDSAFHRVDQGRFAANYLMGTRSFSPNFSKMVGAYVSYDTRRLLKETLHQIGLGAELFHECWDLRINGYIPFKKKSAFVDQRIFFYSDGFFIERRQYEKALWGLDVEIGKTIFSSCCLDFYVAIGPYFYGSHCCTNLVGGMGRAVINVGRNLSFRFFMTYDRIFQAKTQGEVALYLPFCCKWWRCLFPPLYRNPIILTDRCCSWQKNY